MKREMEKDKEIIDLKVGWTPLVVQLLEGAFDTGPGVWSGRSETTRRLAYGVAHDEPELHARRQADLAGIVGEA